MTDQNTQKGSIKFALNFHSTELNSLSLPVEIRKSNLSLVQRTLSSETVQLDPGSYYVTTTLPAGQEIVNHVEVKEGELESVELKPDKVDKSPHENLELQHFLRAAVTPRAVGGSESFDILEGLGGAQTDAKVRVFAGNLLAGTLQDVSQLLPKAQSKARDLVQLTIPASKTFHVVQLLQTDKAPLNMAVPVGIADFESPPKDIGAKLVLLRLDDGSYSMDMHLQHETADLLCHYSAQNLFQQVAVAANSLARDAQKLLKQKTADPLAAAVGAYALLRIGAVEQLSDWTENLKNWFPWLPDGLTVRGEHLSRQGKHEEALDLFMQLPQRGMPIFSDGLMYAIDRLQSCVSLGIKEYDSGMVTEAKELLERLQDFATYVDFGNPVLTYTGYDPLNPSDTPLDVLPDGGKEVSQYIFWN